MMKIVKLKYRFAAGVLETDIWKGCSCAGIDGENPWIHKGFIDGKSFKCFYKLRFNPLSDLNYISYQLSEVCKGVFGVQTVGSLQFIYLAIAYDLLTSNVSFCFSAF